MNFTRWSARLPGTQRRNSAAQAAQAVAARTQQASESADGAKGADGVDGADGADSAGPVDSTGTVPAARGERRDPAGACGPGPGSAPGALVTRSIDALSVHDLLGQVPALAAVVHGADHRIAYVNDAYTAVFGPRAPGAAAREALPELVELGLLPLMDQVLRSGKPRTVKARRVPGAAEPRDGRESRDAFYTFTCTPITADSDSGVLIFAADVTDQVEVAERLRASERRQREAAVTLQRSLLPQELEQPDDLRVAATYQPGGTEAAVGGDWYDVITIGAGRTALVIGDVMGRGVRAAAVMGQLRTAVRAYARLDLPPHEVLQLLDGLAAEIDSSQIATCVYAVHDPNEGVLHYASAGHLPIIVRDADGTV
ncbi:MAG: PP2C family protein-serine/threonine phosphatase, partial [Streptomyces sp.]